MQEYGWQLLAALPVCKKRKWTNKKITIRNRVKVPADRVKKKKTVEIVQLAKDTKWTISVSILSKKWAIQIVLNPFPVE